MSKREIPDEVREKARLELARKHYRYYLPLVHHGNYMPLPHTELIANTLQRIVDGEQMHIIIELPPRHGKSLSVTETFPSYFLGRFPNKKVITAAYSDSLARNFGRLNRNKFLEFAPQVFSEAIADDNGSVADWSVLDNTGGMVSTGIGGSITGKGADCFVAGTMIDTEIGKVDIQALHEMKDKPKVLSLSHSTGELSYNVIKASREIKTNETTTIKTKSGNTLISTPDHRYYEFERGYKEAKDFKQGDYLTKKQNMCELWQDKERAWHVMQNMLSTKTWKLRFTFLRQLWESFYEKEIRIRQENTKWRVLLLLQQTLLSKTPKFYITEKVHSLQPTSSKKNNEILFGSMQRERQNKTRNTMPHLRQNFPSSFEENSLLFTRLCKQSSQLTNDGEEQPALQRWNQLCKMVFGNASFNFRTRQKQVCSMSQRKPNSKIQSFKSANTSYRRKPIKQLRNEFNNFMSELPYDTPQIERDPIQSVTTTSEKTFNVYDIQVEKDCNFFANEILAHNCLIIDDPLKNAKEAQSQTIRDTIWQEWESTLSTRLHKGASVIVIMTRWHEDDFVGRLLENSPYNWTRLRLPAVAEDDDDLLGREIGETLSPELGFDKTWAENKKIEVGSRTWASLYQQRPAPSEGSIFKRQWFNYVDTAPYRHDDIVMSWDFTFSDTTESDYVVGQVWKKQGADFYLIDQIRDQIDFTQSVRAVVNLKKKHPRCRTILIEDKANGPAIINTLRKEVSGIVPIKPRESKVARANAITPYFEAQNVHILNSLPHLNDMIEEWASFPNSKNDDTVDAMTQALNYFAEKPANNIFTTSPW